MTGLPALPSISVALESLDKLETDIRNAPSFKALDTAAAAAAAIQRTFRPVKEVADRAGEVWTSAEIKLAEELEKLPKAKGGEQFHKEPTGTTKAPVPTLQELGVDKKRASRAKRLKSLPRKQRDSYVRQLKEEGKGVTPHAVLKKHQEHERGKKREQYAQRVSPTAAAENLTALVGSGQKFGVILADPPWKFDVYDDATGKDRSPDYETMSAQAIAALPVAELADDDCALLLWTTMPRLPDALEILKAWQFKFSTVGFVWIKQNKSGEGLFMGGGYFSRSNAELLLLGTKGSPMRMAKDVHQVIMAPVGEHSAKPEEARKRIERLLPGPFLELFARRIAPNWTSWGAEV